MKHVLFYVIKRLGIEMKKQKIVFMGTPEYATQILQGLIENGYDICLVVTQPDKKVGRKQTLSQSSVKKFALEHGLSVFQPEKIRIQYQEILAYKPDLIITAAYGQIIPKELLDAPSFGCINLHGSILPKYRGGAPIQWAIINGETKTGVTLMYMDEKMDSGDIIAISEIEITNNDNLGTVFQKMALCAKELLLQNIEQIFARTNQRLQQDISQVTYAWNIKKTDEEIDIMHKTAQEIHNHVRGLYPNVVANIKVQGQTYKFHVSEVVDQIDVINPQIGTFIKFNKEVYLYTIDKKFVKIITIQKIGKKPISGKDFANQIK